ncbi:MAG: hypothetical protein M0P49_01530 [Bacilli bacterium]|jgi:hypothetical protein|nr:hypothetical protein [Bacilli bacterium]
MDNIINFNNIKERKNIDNALQEIGKALADYLCARVKLILNTIFFEGIEEDPMEIIFGELVLECKEKILSEQDSMSEIGTLEFIYELDIKIENIIKNRMKSIATENECDAYVESNEYGEKLCHDKRDLKYDYEYGDCPYEGKCNKCSLYLLRKY